MKLDLGPHDPVPDTYDRDVFVEYVMPNSMVSRAQVRSISIDTETSPDKWVHHLAKYEYKVCSVSYISPLSYSLLTKYPYKYLI